MRHILGKAVLVLAALTASTAALSQDATRTYRGLSWNFSTTVPGFSGCTLAFMDATGVPGLTVNYLMYGELYCPSFGGSYNVDGNGFFDSFNRLNMMVTLGVAYKLVCPLNGSSLSSGDCSIYDNMGNRAGAASMFLR